MSAERKPEDDEDTRLMERIKGGDEQALALLYDRMSPYLFGVVGGILHDEKEAEDVVQEGFLHLWKKAGVYDPARCKPSTWAIMIFRNKAIDRLRARNRYRLRVERAALEPAPFFDPHNDTGRNVAVLERGSAVRTALEQIPEEKREAITLAFFTGLTQAQISEKLGEPLGTIKARIRRGLLKLRDGLKGKI